ncbi:MAG: alkaline phosphatase [Thermoguttaceae bacterium]
MKKTCTLFVVFLLLYATSLFAEHQPKNVILMIGDGMGFNADLAGTFWRLGPDGKQVYHDLANFPVSLGVTTYEVLEETPQSTLDNPGSGYDPAVFWANAGGADASVHGAKTTDSASAATAMYTGTKTLNGRISTDKWGGKPLETVAEYAKQRGKKTGAVTTVQASHATPAAVAAHVKSREQYSDIFNQMVSGPTLDVIMGGGHPYFENGTPVADREKAEFKYVGGEETWNKLIQGDYNGFTWIDSKEDFECLATGCGADSNQNRDAENKLPKKVVGIARTCRYPVLPVDGVPNDNDYAAKRLEQKIGKEALSEIPTLSTMSVGALNVLNQGDSGFFVMIEGGAIDWANHDNVIEDCIMHHTGFTKAIEAVCDWVEKNSNWDETLLIVTADHETGRLWGPLKFGSPVGAYLAGSIPAVHYSSGGHTNALAPLWAKGAGSNLFEKWIRGTDEKAGEFWGFDGGRGRYIDNTDIARTIREAVGP